MSGSGLRSSGGRARRRGSRFAGSRAAALARLSELDREILRRVSSHRVVTQTQLARLLPDTPERTLRYRTERLFEMGLLGRSRPYHDSGSHPFHFWPTRQADASVRGEPVRRGGERVEPNPLFLAHAAGVSELYVVLATGIAEGLTLRGFRREGEAREPFGTSGRQRALAPDALVDLRDERERQLLAFVELDLGTMSRPRLRAKAAGYAAYAHEMAWTERHSFCPTLLFVTTTDARALAFLKLLAGELRRLQSGGFYYYEDEPEDWFAAAACAHAHDPARALAERCWDDRSLSSGLTLRDCLEQARVPYERACAAAKLRERERQQQRAELLAHPQKLRRHLCRKQHLLRGLLEGFVEEGARALRLLLERNGPVDAREQETLMALAQLLGEQLLDVDDVEPESVTEGERACVERLAVHYREQQLAMIASLTSCFGDGPRLRGYRQQLAQGRLLDEFVEARLELDARRDGEARARQERLRLAYLERREREARYYARKRGLARYLLHGSDAFYSEVDHRWLRFCEECQEIAYPGEHEAYGTGPHSPLRQCHFCESTSLKVWDEQWRPLLEAGRGASAGGLGPSR